MSNDSQEKNSTPKGNQKPSASTENNQESISTDELFSEIYDDSIRDDDHLAKGLANLNSLPKLDSKEFTPVAGRAFERGVIGFRRAGNSLVLAIACGKAQVRYLTLEKFIALVENMDDPVSSTIMIQNFQDQDDYKSAKGQVLARINPASSAIHVIQGLTARIIRNPSDIAAFDVYYLDRTDLTSFYLAAKAQISIQNKLDAMIATYDGWKAFNVPLDPLNPYGE